MLGAGPLGILATALLRLAGVYIFVADIVSKDSPKVHLVKHMGANYVDARGKKPNEIVEFCCGSSGRLDTIFEASGAAASAIELVKFGRPHKSRTYDALTKSTDRSRYSILLHEHRKRYAVELIIPSTRERGSGG